MNTHDVDAAILDVGSQFIPNFEQRLLGLVEKESEHRRRMDVARATLRKSERKFALANALMPAAAAAYLSTTGYSIAAIMAAMASFGILLIYGLLTRSRTLTCAKA